MTPGKSEKIKLYIVVGLAIAAAIVAYFRFVYTKTGADADIAGHPSGEVKFVVPPIKKNKPKGQNQASRLPANMTFSMAIRDIFMPAPLPVEPKPIDPVIIPVEPSPAPIGVLELKGTIIGGKASMAVINDKFVRMGEKIGAYQIVKIDSNEVVLRSGSNEIALYVLTPGKKK